MSTVHPNPVIAADPAVFRTRAAEVYAQLKRDVAEFKLVPGDRFTENEISERLGVSRTPVRQALFRLQQEGFVEVLFRSGWRVLPFDFDQFEQFYDLRMILETTAVHRLCETDRHIDRTAIDRLADIWLVPGAQRSSATAQVAKWDEEFHCTLVAAAGNAEMARAPRGDRSHPHHPAARLHAAAAHRRDLRRAREDTQGCLGQPRRPGSDAAAGAYRDESGGGEEDHAASGAHGKARGGVRPEKASAHGVDSQTSFRKTADEGSVPASLFFEMHPRCIVSVSSFSVDWITAR